MSNICYHLETAIRFKVDALDRRMYQRQCLACGLARSQFLKHAEVPADPNMKPWDRELEQRTHDAFVAETEAMQKRGKISELEYKLRGRDQEWASFYEDYMQSTKWRTKCAAVHKRDKGVCQGCLEQPGRHVHHLTYDRLGDELLIDLVLLCRGCHERVHPHMRGAAE